MHLTMSIAHPYPYCMDMKIICPANNDVLDEVMETLARDISFEGAPTQIR